MIFLSLSLFSLEIFDIEKSWKEKGYTVIEEDNLKIVELSFQFDNVLSLNETSHMLYIITYFNHNKLKPDNNYISDVEKVLINSSFSEEIVRSISNQLSTQATWQNSFFATDLLQVNTMLYDQMTPVLRMTFLEKQAVNQIDVENEKEDNSKIAEKEEELNALKKEYEVRESENQQLSLETEILSNENAVLKKTNQNLKEDLEKYKDLSEYKDKTIFGLKNTIDRYVSIEKQKNETIKDLQKKMDVLKEEYSLKEVDYQKLIRDLETQIKSLELTINKQLLEIKLIKETEEQLLERIEQLKEINENQIGQLQTESSLDTTKEATDKIHNTSNQIDEKKPLTIESTNITIMNQKEIEKNNGQTPAEFVEQKKLQNENQPLPLLKKVIVYDKGEKTVTIENEYNDNGDLIREQFLSPEGKTLMITEIIYNSDGLVKERVNYESSQMVGKHILQYDDQQRVIRVFTYNQESLTHYSLLEYNENISKMEPIKVKYFYNNQLDSYEENEFNNEGKIIKTVQRKPDGQAISQKVYDYENDELQTIIFYQFGEKTSYQINIYNEHGMQKSQKTYDAKDQLISEIVFIWDEVE